jgi:nitrite reductase (NADH) large subunit
MIQNDPERTICFCYCVSYAEIVAAIREGHRTLAEIKRETRASTACGGCECEVLEILEAEPAQASAPGGGDPSESE